MTKAELRSEFRQKRRGLSEADWQNRCHAITALFFDIVWSKPVSTVGVFLPIESQKEVDTWPLVRRLWQDFPQVRVAAPITDLISGEMENREIRSTTDFTKNRYGIPEPSPAFSSLLPPFSFDTILVPLLAFDQTGNRVGYGGGFYDRFLAQCRPDCVKIGLSLFDPVEQIEDIYRGDISLNFCITPDRVWAFP